VARLKDRRSNVGLRAWLLQQEQELFDAMTAPPRTPVDGRPATAVPPELQAALAEELSKPLQALAEGREYQLERMSLPLDHPERRVGDPGDVLVLTAGDELRLAD
jgi:hypothetical protein